MIKYFFLHKIRFVFILIVLFISPFFYLQAENKEIAISKLQVFKRNKASCNRLGNIYDACHWMAKFTIKNTSQNKISKFCLRMKVNKKVFELCYGKTKKNSINVNNKKTFLVNLTELFGISIDDEKPLVRVFKVR